MTRRQPPILALTALGLDWKAFDPAAAPPLAILKAPERQKGAR